MNKNIIILQNDGTWKKIEKKDISPEIHKESLLKKYLETGVEYVFYEEDGVQFLKDVTKTKVYNFCIRNVEITQEVKSFLGRIIQNQFGVRSKLVKNYGKNHRKGTLSNIFFMMEDLQKRGDSLTVYEKLEEYFEGYDFVENVLTSSYNASGKETYGLIPAEYDRIIFPDEYEQAKGACGLAKVYICGSTERVG